MNVDLLVCATMAVAGLLPKLTSKSTFIPTVRDLTSVCERDGDTPVALFGAAKRVNTLLRTRYTNPTCWAAGYLFFSTLRVRPLSGKLSATELKELDDWIALAKTESDGLTAESKPGSTTSEPLGAPRPVPVAGEPTTLTPEMIQAFLAALATVSVSGTQNLSELDSGPPPASRDARDGLLVKAVYEDDQSCPICQEVFPRRARAKQMPCGHLFHEECLLSWLEKRNSCPVCRKTLPSEKQHFDDVAEKIQKRDTASLHSTGLFS
eukprot:TRINITY_DN15079_c0_g1_i1.p1 TRINITY_DN15079_c0_g1~~TRINITY_DN15079_c0_g1_i1.p1  ORF type:complete len:265 (+),score=33.57 TRINITY_DN15079_c0_g1_i1:3-797(+)